ncbi:TonB-dependent receptor [Alteromonas pelagimontana]|uniref:TonB-dependent receptor n=1 Tax=Alteromonas pelagimontana TaxID=1858656 RepID=A0A6M4MAU5_9ALTE|nr:TonB-dependent receptor [Alteromonas pelagimontana]QJR80157.1 TonB-dependent receptor [Alteromonas pelagimontana]
MQTDRLTYNKLGTAILLALGISHAPAVLAQETTSKTPSEADIEVIEVGGFRGALNRALFEKRSAVTSKETILSEDIGKFPDLNIAESLQRVPGVAISREGGEGRQITLRGLGPAFTRTTLNGMEVPASTDGTDSGGGVNGGRAFDFNVFASELFNRVDIQKTSTASTEEGGIAGTVDLYSAKPFSNPGFHVTAAGQGGYNDVTEEVDPRMVFMISNTFADDTIGALFSVAKSERTVRQEGYGTVRWTTPVDDGSGIYTSAATANTQITGSPASDNCEYEEENVSPINCLWTPRLPRYDFFGNKQERLGITGTLQFAVGDIGTVTFDTLQSKLENDRTMYNNFEMFRSTFSEITPVAITIDDSGQQVIAGTFDNLTSRVENRQQVSETDFSQYVLSGEFFLTDALRLDAMVGTASSDARSEQYRYNMTNLTPHRFSFDFTGNPNVPVMEYGYDYTDPTLYDLSDGRLRATAVDRDNDTAKIDLAYQGAELEVKMGLAYNDRSVNYREEQINDFPDQDSAEGFTQILPYDDFGHGFDGPLNTFLVADFAAIEDQLLEKNWTPRTEQSWEIGEETLAGYLEFNYDQDIAGMNLKSNFGMRYVKTTSTATGYIQLDEVTVENDYDNFLPALNLALSVTDDVVTRLGISSTMTRPSLGSLNPGNPSFSYVNGTVSAGNPYLDPFTSNNVDVGLEWYFAEESLLAANYFYKDIETFITSSTEERLIDEVYLPFIDSDPQYDPAMALDPRTVPYTHTSPVNGEGTSVKGVEFIYQQPFRFLPAPFDGLGVVMNYTRVSAGEITGLSKNTYNATLYYERDAYGIRLSLNKRDDYITSYSGSNGNAEEGTTGPTYLDLSAFYNYNENLTFTIEGINLTDEYERLFTTGYGSQNLIREYNHTGTQIFLGARYTM